MNRYGNVDVKEINANRSETMNVGRFSFGLITLIALMGCQNQQVAQETQTPPVEAKVGEMFTPLPAKEEIAALVEKANKVSKDWLNNHFEETYKQLASISQEKEKGSRLDATKRYRMTETYRIKHPIVRDLHTREALRQWKVVPMPISVGRSNLVISLGDQKIVDKLLAEIDRNNKRVGTWESQFWKRIALLEFEVKGRKFYQIWFREDNGKWSIMHWPFDLHADLYRDYEKFALEFRPPPSR
jgi:hypothetical protein